MPARPRDMRTWVSTRCARAPTRLLDKLRARWVMRMTPSFKEVMVRIACTGVGEEKGIEPLAAYLADGHELTPYLREWVVAMLRRDKAHKHHLIYKKRVGRPKPTTPASPKEEDLLVIAACSSGGSIEPFIDW